MPQPYIESCPSTRKREERERNEREKKKEREREKRKRKKRKEREKERERKRERDIPTRQRHMAMLPSSHDLRRWYAAEYPLPTTCLTKSHFLNV